MASQPCRGEPQLWSEMLAVEAAGVRRRAWAAVARGDQALEAISRSWPAVTSIARGWAQAEALQAPEAGAPVSTTARSWAPDRNS